MGTSKYTAEFRADAVALYYANPGRTYASVADDLGVNHETLRVWVREAEAAAVPGAAESTALEKENKALTWPHWPLKLRTSSSQAEGAARDFSVATSRFIGSNDKVEQLECVHLDPQMKPVPGTEFQIPADLVLLAMGFLHPVHEGMVKDLNVNLDARGNVKANEIEYRTSRPKVFAAGDMRRGQSLVVWAIREGRQAAHAIDKFLMGKTDLPR